MTGGTGFIGSLLTKALVQQNAKVLLFCLPSSDSWRLNSLLNKVAYVRLDKSLNISSVLKDFDPEVVYHLASYIDVTRDISLMEKMIQSNFVKSLDLVKSLSEAKSLKLFVNTGSSDEYGDNLAPFRESSRERPVSPYSLSKTLTTHSIGFLSRMTGFPSLTVRPFTTYGGWQAITMLIPDLISHILEGKNFSMTSGEQTRDFIYIDDIVEAYLWLAQAVLEKRLKADGEIFNIGTGQEIPVNRVVQKIIEIMGEKISLREGEQVRRQGEPSQFFADITKIKEIGWKAKVDLDKGLSYTIQWYRDHYFLYQNQLIK